MVLTPGMKDPARNTYLLTPVVKLRQEIPALEATCRALAGLVSPRLDDRLLDAHHRLQFARAAMRIRDEIY